MGFDDFHAAYLIGSLALATILFQGGLATEREMIEQALWPSVALATVGVVVSAVIVGVAARWLFDFSWREALLLGAATARPMQPPCRCCFACRGQPCRHG